MAKQALQDGPAKMIALNAANEVLVNKYLNDEIKFTDIAKGVKQIVDLVPNVRYAALPLIKFIDRYVRKETERCLIQ